MQTSTFAKFLRSQASFLRSQDGGSTMMGFFILSAGLLMGGYAVDVGSLEQQRTLMQATADSVAHDALVTRELQSEGDAVASAVLRANDMMREQDFGAVLDAQDVVFGTWDRATRQFSPQSGARTAVQVLLRRTRANGNAISTYLMKLVGINEWDVVVRATFATYQPICLREGFVAQGVVDIQSNNSYLRNFCIHSNTYVKLSSNNFFEPGTVVSMPDLSLLQLPASGFETNPGLTEALREGSYNIRILRRIQRIIDGMTDTSSPYYPEFLTSPTPVALTDNRIDAADLPSGHVYIWSCNSGPGGTIENGTVVSGVVIIANCDITLGNGTALEDAIILTTSTSDTSIKSPNGLRLGVNDGCTQGGGGRIVSMGGMNFAADLELYGSQLLGLGDISFAAKADGIEGASVISNGAISGTSNMSMSFCGRGMDEFTADYFQLVN